MRGRFVRGGDVLTYDISRPHPTGPYRLHVNFPDGHEAIEEIGDASELIDHVAQLMRRLRLEGWELEQS